MIIGLTGGIASGKSTVSHILRNMGACIIDVDLIAREIVKPGEPAFLAIVEYFGKEILFENGELDRKKLGSIVFSDAKALNKLNEITHGILRRETEIAVKGLAEKGHPAIIVDAALLYEIGLDEFVNVVWFVFANEETQISRMRTRDGFSEIHARERILAQNPGNRERATVVIENQGSIMNLEDEVKKLWNIYIGA